MLCTPSAQRYPHDAIPANHNGPAPPTRRPPRQSQEHRATHTTLSPPMPTAQRYPYHALPANHNGTVLPTRRPPCQSQRHSATHKTPSPPIPTAQRHPHNILPANHNGTRYPHDALPANHNGTALPIGRPPRQSQRHSATHTTPYPLIPTEQRCHTPTRQPRYRPIPTAQRIGHDKPTTNPHGTATQRSAQTTPVQANPKGTAHRSHRERARSFANAISFPKAERTQAPQSKTRTLRYAFGKKGPKPQGALMNKPLSRYAFGSTTERCKATTRNVAILE